MCDLQEILKRLGKPPVMVPGMTIPAGEEIYHNLLFLNSRLWGFQHPAALAMRKEGTPIGGVIVAAGVPSSMLRMTLATISKNLE